MRLALVTLWLVATLSPSGCHRTTPPEYEGFLNLPLSEQHKVLRNLPLEKRMDYYLAAMEYNEPPGVGLADDIAREGKMALPILTKRLREEKDERVRIQIIRIFEFMHAHYYKLKNESEILTQLRETIDSMKDAGNRQSGMDMLRHIESDPPQ